MSLIVETGAGLSNAESYISVADASARQVALGNETWSTISNAEMEEALRRATAFMTQSYRQRWTGQRLTPAQALDWPRYDVCVDGFYVPSDSLPADIANACADLALKAAAGELNADLTRGVTRRKVGPIEVEFDRYSPQSVRYPAIAMALAPYLKGASANASLVRA